ncbi:MAG: hypothetical protein RI575_05645 [Balneolaceae bacterium]|nr:hypothetical protein [Balneolaceae bacterium]MDR9410311.1 hypothetical protein [Balneolaceae bacterium]
MRHSKKITTFLIAVLAMTATSCYTQLRTTYSSYPGNGYYSSDSNTERVASSERSVEERGDQVVNEEDYTLGYDDGWSDAEAYYFKDYEAKRWYEEYGATLAHDPYVRHYTLNHYYGRGYSPFHSYYYPHYPYYSYFDSWNFSIGFHFGWGWNSWRHRYAYHPFYDYYAYPGYYPYYGGYYGWGYRPYYGNTFVIYNGSRGTSRNYGPRNNGLSSRGSETVRRTRSDARVRNTANRSDIRSNARSRNVSTTRSRGTVNRSSGTTRSRSSSTVRSRSGSNSNSRGTVNRGSSNRSRSNGTVNRSRSSSSSRSNGTVNRSRSSSNNRSNNGTVNRSRSSSQSRANVGSEGVIISRGTSIIRNRDNDRNRNTVNQRVDINSRDRAATVNNRIRSYNNANNRSAVESNRPQTRRERSLNSIRNSLLEQKAESPNQRYTRQSRDRSSSSFNNKAVRDVYKSIIGTSRSNNNSRSSVNRSSSSSKRSSSVTRSRSNNSNRSTVRSSRSSSSSSKSRGSSSRSRSSSSSRDRN